MYLPIIHLGLDMVWLVSTIIISLTVYFTIRAIIKLPRYTNDRRRHFYPLQKSVLVLGGLIVLLRLVFWATNHTPPSPVLPLPNETTTVLAFICTFIVLLQNWYQHRLPLTNNQRRYRTRKHKI